MQSVSYSQVWQRLVAINILDVVKLVAWVHLHIVRLVLIVGIDWSDMVASVHLLEVLLLASGADGVRDLRVVLLVFEQVIEVAIVGARVNSGHNRVLLLVLAGRARLRAGLGLVVLRRLFLKLRFVNLVWVEERIEMRLVRGQVKVHAGSLILEVIHS